MMHYVHLAVADDSLLHSSPLLVAKPHGAPVSPQGDIDATHGEATAVPFMVAVEEVDRMALQQDAHRTAHD